MRILILAGAIVGGYLLLKLIVSIALILAIGLSVNP